MQDDLPSQADSDAIEDDQELLFDPFDRQEVEEEPELIFMGNDDDDELSSQEEADESDWESIEDRASSTILRPLRLKRYR
jgi:hypothetical protein